MNGLDKIIEKIISDAQEKAKAYENEIAEQIDTLKREATDEIMRMENDYISRAEATSEQILMRADSSSTLEARNIILERKAQIIDEAFKLAREKLLSLPKTQYVELITKALVYAIEQRLASKKRLLELYGEQEAELDAPYEAIFNEADSKNGNAKKIVTAAIAIIDKSVKLTKASYTAEIDGGFILKCNDIEINCSLTALVNEVRAKCEARVIQALLNT